jgi:hypothetical protein
VRHDAGSWVGIHEKVAHRAKPSRRRLARPSTSSARLRRA